MMHQQYIYSFLCFTTNKIFYKSKTSIIYRDSTKEYFITDNRFLLQISLFENKNISHFYIECVSNKKILFSSKSINLIPKYIKIILYLEQKNYINFQLINFLENNFSNHIKKF